VVNATADADGRAVPGRAGAITRALRDDGFAQAYTGPGAQSQAITSVEYPATLGAQAAADARAVAAALRIPATSVTESTAVAGITVEVGADWTSGSHYTAAAPDPARLPADADELNASDTHACMDVYQPYRW
jgi:hypothetical protein